ncbi:hypothetical protein RUM43_009697 [Polyplax serrata]|uniref:Uncharacterized protein n=1 Tax=Polyplax serrata TaxID=468196 RepID=A0AAN8PKD0_POLSC
MAEVDPETLLEWLSIGQGDERDMQLIALEQLCMLLLMSDNVDRCFESTRRAVPGSNTRPVPGQLLDSETMKNTNESHCIFRTVG